MMKEKSEYPPDRHGKGSGVILHPLVDLLKPAVPDRDPFYGARLDMEKNVSEITTASIPQKTIGPEYEARSGAIGVSHIQPNAPADVPILAPSSCCGERIHPVDHNGRENAEA